MMDYHIPWGEVLMMSHAPHYKLPFAPVVGWLPRSAQRAHTQRRTRGVTAESLMGGFSELS